MPSVEEKVEEYCKKELDKYNIRHYGKTERINEAISKALTVSESKSGNKGNNYPDIKILLDNQNGRRIPVMIEAKGVKGRLEKKDKNGDIEQVTTYPSDSNPDAKNPHKKGDANYSTIQNYAVNGALHYGNAILNEGTYNEVIIIGINGSKLNDEGELTDFEMKSYYVSKNNNKVPKLIAELNDENLSLLKNVDRLCQIVDKLSLTDKEIERLKNKTEEMLEEKIKSIHQNIYESERIKTALTTNEKLYLFCGLIIAGMKTTGVMQLDVSDLKSFDNDKFNDGTIIMQHIETFLYSKNCPTDRIDIIKNLLMEVFKKPVLWKPMNGLSMLHILYDQVRMDVIPCFDNNLHLDFTGKILNSLNDWVGIENDSLNDVVLTPRYVTKLMADMARVDMNSFVWDATMGSAGFLTSAIDVMEKDAKNKIFDERELQSKIQHIKNNQILGIEILGNIYILAVLNMILMDGIGANMINGDSHGFKLPVDFPADVFLLNPPYSAPGKGFCFVEEALEQMKKGYACILIQDSAGSGQGLPYTKRILKHNTLEASIKMPNGLFSGKASVSVNIYVFKVNRPHEEDDEVTFIDFSEDGYTRQSRKKSTSEVNLKNTDHAEERYDEVVAIVTGKKPKTNYYTKENGKVIKDVISLNGDDWNFYHHRNVDTKVTKGDIKEGVKRYLKWKTGTVIDDK